MAQYQPLAHPSSPGPALPLDHWPCGAHTPFPEEAAPRQWQRRGVVLLAVAMVLMVVLALAALLWDFARRQATHGKAPGTLRLRNNMEVDRTNELRIIPERVARYGLLNTTLRVMTAQLTTGPLTFEGRTYEGHLMGPTLRVWPGDTLVIHLVNELGADSPHLQPYTLNTLHSPNTTNLHVHGLHVPPTSIADNTFRTVAPGTSSFSVYNIPTTHSPGLFYYHPHYHGSSLLQTMASMAGCIIVEDPRPVPPRLAAMREVVLGLQQIQVVGGTPSNYIFASHATDSTLPLHIHQVEAAPDAVNHFTVNGQHQPTLFVRPGEATRWRLVNAGYSALLNLQLQGCEVHVLAADGIMLARPRPVSDNGTVLVATGSRRELAVRCHRRGAFLWRSVQPINALHMHFVGASKVWVGTLMAVRVAGRRMDMRLPKALPTPSPFLFRDLRGEANVMKFDFVWTRGEDRIWGVNHQPFSSTVRRVVRLNTVEEWRITTDTPGGGHPFHLHTNHFQVVSVSEGEGLDFKVGDWRDTIMCPEAGEVTIRFRPTDFTGKTLAHCHIFAHHDTGMIFMFEIVP
eukprot:GGOE01041297.1.p1 GENE.GGOE01041297.1~~GGOE01041297.1.p1  ORF type:complete len:584 (-),score=142.82 GGOE01041297.1:236-1948(-)